MHSHATDAGMAPPVRFGARWVCVGIFLVLLIVASSPAAGIDLQMVTECSSPSPNSYCIFGEPVVSPDGGCIAYTNGTTYPPYYEWWPAIVFIPVGGGSCVPTGAAAQSSNWHESPAWSPDGTRLAFVSEGWASDDEGIWTVEVGDTDGSSLEHVAAGPQVFDPAWSLNGAVIAFTAVDGVRAGPSSGGGSLLIAAGGHAPSWGPDGQLVFVRGGDLWIRRSDGSERQLTATPEAEEAPAWSPQGVWIAYVSNQGGNWDLWVIAATGGTPVRVTASIENEGHPSWTARGDRLVYSATLNDHDSIWTATGLPDWTVGVERTTWGNMKSMYR